MARARTLAIVGLAALVALLSTWLLRWRFVGDTLDPISYAVFFWPHRFDFVALVLACGLFLAGRIVAAYRGQKQGGRVSGLVLTGIGLGIALHALLSMDVVRPARLQWFHPAEASAGPAAGAVQQRLDLLDAAGRKAARRLHRPMAYYFRADWCTHCPEFERYKLRHPAVARALRAFVLVRMDVTDFARWQTYVERNYAVQGTPTLLFRDRRGRILRGATVEGDDITPRSLELLVQAVARGKSFTRVRDLRSKARKGPARQLTIPRARPRGR